MPQQRTVSAHYTLTSMSDGVRIDLAYGDRKSAWAVFTGEDARTVVSTLREHLDFRSAKYSAFLQNGYWNGTIQKGVPVEVFKVSQDFLVLAMFTVAFVLDRQEVEALVEALDRVVVT